MNVYVLEMAKSLGQIGYEIDIITRKQDEDSDFEVRISDMVRLLHLSAGPADHTDKRKLFEFMPEFVQSFLHFHRGNRRQYDLVDAHYYLSGLIGLEIKKHLASSMPLVMTFPHFGFDEKFGSARFERAGEHRAFGRRVFAVKTGRGDSDPKLERERIYESSV